MDFKIDRRSALKAGAALAAAYLVPAGAQAKPNIRFAAVFSDKDIRADTTASKVGWIVADGADDGWGPALSAARRSASRGSVNAPVHVLGADQVAVVGWERGARDVAVGAVGNTGFGAEDEG